MCALSKRSKMKFFTDQAKEEANAARDALVIDAIVEWARSLPVGVAEVDVAGDVVAVRPRNPRAADFEIFPEYDTVFNFLLAGEQMYPRLDRAFAILLLEALAQGRCQRTLWERRGKVIGARTEFLDPHGQVFYRYSGNVPWVWLFGKPPRLVRYEAY